MLSRAATTGRRHPMLSPSQREQQGQPQAPAEGAGEAPAAAVGLVRLQGGPRSREMCCLRAQWQRTGPQLALPVQACSALPLPPPVLHLASTCTCLHQDSKAQLGGGVCAEQTGQQAQPGV